MYIIYICHIKRNTIALIILLLFWKRPENSCWIYSRRIIVNTIMFPLWVGGRIRPPFPYVSYEATKSVSQWQRVYSVGLRRPPACVSSTGIMA